MIEQVRLRLSELAEPEFKVFQQKMIPGAGNVLGVRTPAMRKLGKEIVKDDWRAFLAESDGQSYEERILEAFVIAGADMSVEQRFDYLREFIPRIDNWAVCDMLCSSLSKFAKKEPAALWDFLTPWVASPREFEVRFGVVMPLSFINGDYIDRVFALIDSLEHDGYYAKMGAAWTLSLCAVRFFDKTFEYLKTDNIDEFTHNKAIQKSRESYRVAPEQKQALLALKRTAEKK